MRISLCCIAATILAGSLLLTGCGGADVQSSSPGGAAAPVTSSGPRPDTGGTTLTGAEMVAAFKAATDKMQALLATSLTRTTRNTQLAAYIKTLPAFAASGIQADGTVWGRLKNNMLYVMDDTYLSTGVKSSVVEPKTVTPQRIDAPPLMTQVANPAATDNFDLPETHTAYLVRGVLGACDSAITTAQKTLAKRGYTAIVKEGDVEAMKTIHGAALLYIVTHGGSVYRDSDKTNYWALYTSTQVTDTNSTTYAGDLADGSLVFMTAARSWKSDGTPVLQTSYAITVNFIKKYGWSFNTHSIAFINACHSDQYHMTDWLLALPHPPAMALGYSDVAYIDESMKTSRAFMECLTGVYVNENVAKGRPFDALAAYGKLSGLGFDGGNGTQWICKYTKNVLLNPSIGRMAMYERAMENPMTGKPRLEINGLFGTVKPKVTIGGQEVVFVSQTPKKLVVEPAETPGPGFSGRVQVEQGVMESNVVPLTYWTGTADYDIDATPSPYVIHFNVHSNLKFRGDIHPARVEPWITGPMTEWPPASVYMRAAESSTTAWKYSGSPIPGTAWTNSSGTSPYGLNGAVEFPFGRGYVFDLKLQPKTKNMYVNMNWLGGVLSFTSAGMAGQMVAIHDNKLVANTSGQRDAYNTLLYSSTVLGTMAQDGTIGTQTFTGTTANLNPKLKISALTPDATIDTMKGEDLSQ